MFFKMHSFSPTQGETISEDSVGNCTFETMGGVEGVTEHFIVYRARGKIMHFIVVRVRGKTVHLVHH